MTRFRGALEAPIRHLEGGRTLDVEAEIHAMTQFHNRGTELGDAADLEIAVVLQLLRETGDLERARATMQRYVDDFGRSRAPMRGACVMRRSSWAGRPTTNSAGFGSRLRA